ncbi:MAG: disulfide bond formation protein DsbA [Gammaproteobacteria bacterium]|nr:MAG: disulfide bond formation protein DsbA [Gammaproteobacteria bacterium]
MPEQKIAVDHFSDVLCIWAYLAQVRMDRLQDDYPDQITVTCHFLPIFGCVNTFIQEKWGHRGGAEGYNRHVLSIAEGFQHISVHPDIWKAHRPTSSISCHIFLKAVQLLEARNGLASSSSTSGASLSSGAVIWAMRQAFFRDLRDISNRQIQLEIAEELGLPINALESMLDSGEACAALERDHQLQERYRIAGSPTLVLNEGRQIIYGNVGYRVIEANVHELLRQPADQASWC